MVKEDIYTKAKQLGIKKENLDEGMKEHKEDMEKMVSAAHAFMNKADVKAKAEAEAKKRSP